MKLTKKELFILYQILLDKYFNLPMKGQDKIRAEYKAIRQKLLAMMNNERGK